MFDKFERIVGVFVVLMAFLVFWSPILVIVLIIIFILFLIIKSKYFKTKSSVELLNNKNRQKTSQVTNENRFGSNMRQIKSARRQLPVGNTNVNNYFSNYSMDSLNANHFLQSDSVFSLMSGQPFVSRPQSANDMSYSPSIYRPIRESPMSQLGNLPFVKLMSSGSDSSTHELKPKISPVKPVTVRIAPMPQNLTKFTLNRISSLNQNTSHVSTLGAIDSTVEAPNNSATDPKNVVDALKKSLRRKREPMVDFETEDNYKVSVNKKQRKDGNESISIPNGIISTNKPSVKRQANEMTELLNKRFKNNEILSSYSSLKSISLSQSLKNKRKLSPDLKESEVVKNKKSLPEEELNLNLQLNVEDNKQFQFSDTNDMSVQFSALNEESEERVLKKSYGLPLHLHSMEDHERDRSKARHRLNRFLNAVKEVSSPTSDSNEQQITIETTAESSSSSTIGLPTEPAAAIFTTSRVETIVTTTLLNTPISSVLTTTKDSLSPQTINVDNTEPSPINCVPNWSQNTAPVFTAKPVPTQSLFSVGTGGSTTRRIAQNSRLRSRQKR